MGIQGEFARFQYPIFQATNETDMVNFISKGRCLAQLWASTEYIDPPPAEAFERWFRSLLVRNVGLQAVSSGDG